MAQLICKMKKKKFTKLNKTYIRKQYKKYQLKMFLILLLLIAFGLGYYWHSLLGAYRQRSNILSASAEDPPQDLNYLASRILGAASTGFASQESQEGIGIALRAGNDSDLREIVEQLYEKVSEGENSVIDGNQKGDSDTEQNVQSDFGGTGEGDENSGQGSDDTSSEDDTNNNTDDSSDGEESNNTETNGYGGTTINTETTKEENSNDEQTDATREKYRKGGCYLAQTISYQPGNQKDGSAIVNNRSNSGRAMGAPQHKDTPNFVSLGFGGTIVTRFSQPVKNIDGMDFRVVETSYGDFVSGQSGDSEKAQVYVSQDGVTWTLLGVDVKDMEFDLGSLEWIQYLKLTDISDKDLVNNDSDGFDLDGVVAYECGPVKENKEKDAEVTSKEEKKSNGSNNSYKKNKNGKTSEEKVDDKDSQENDSEDESDSQPNDDDDQKEENKKQNKEKRDSDEEDDTEDKVLGQTNVGGVDDSENDDSLDEEPSDVDSDESGDEEKEEGVVNEPTEQAEKENKNDSKKPKDEKQDKDKKEKSSKKKQGDVLGVTTKLDKQKSSFYLELFVSLLFLVL